jgi:hypothetical protein
MTLESQNNGARRNSPLLGNGSINTLSPAMDASTAIQEILGIAVFCVIQAEAIYNKTTS